MAPKNLGGLPLLVIGPVDVGRLVRELEQIGAALKQQSIQKQELKLPKTTKLMDQLIEINKLNLLQSADREQLTNFLAAVKQDAPLLHMSFGADPSVRFMEKLMAWLRQNVHPLVLVTVGLQPAIGAGCMLRTTNKFFDFSLSRHFSENRELLMEKLRGGIVASQPGPAVVSAPITPVTQPLEVAVEGKRAVAPRAKEVHA